MKPDHTLSILLSCLTTLGILIGPSLHAEVPASRTQRLKSPDQTPEGLSTADWAGIRAAYEAGRTEVEATGPPAPLTAERTVQQAYLKASNTGHDNRFGYSVAVSGDTVVVGASYAETAYVFTRTGTTWTQQAYLKASNPGTSDQFGVAVAVAGDTVVVGAYGERSSATGVNGNQGDNSSMWAGAAYVFVRSGTEWTQQAYLKASNTGAGDQFGLSVAVSGDTVVVGAYLEDSNATGVNGTGMDGSVGYNSGAAYVFVRSGTEWTQQAYLKASNTEAGDLVGFSVAVSDNTVIVGAYGEDSIASGVNGDQVDNSAGNAGAAYVFLLSSADTTDAEITSSGGDFILNLPGEPGLSYRVQYATSPSAPMVWNEFTPPAIYTAAPDGAVIHRDVNPPDPQRFYRAVASP